MKERPILFSAPMVRALLNGTKTQTRRVVKQSLERLGDGDFYAFDHKGINYRVNARHTTVAAWAHLLQFCPYGQPGDRLYVRETWAQPTTFDPGPTFYRADYPDCVPREFNNVPPASEITWKPSIHMPRSLSRITLEIVGVRVERLQDISDADAIAEGIERNAEYPTLWRRGSLHGDQNTMKSTGFPKLAYRSIWEQINGHESWAANPWVWVVEFKRVTP